MTKDMPFTSEGGLGNCPTLEQCVILDAVIASQQEFLRFHTTVHALLSEVFYRV